MFSHEFMRFLIGYQQDEFLPAKREPKIEITRGKKISDLTKYAYLPVSVNELK